MKLILIYLFQNPLSSGDIKILLKATSDYLFIIHFAFFIQGICRITKQHITTEEFTHSFSNSILCLNKINTSTSLEDIEEAFIYRDIPIKNRKISVKANGSPTTLKSFPLVCCLDRIELLKSGFDKQQENISKLINGNFEITLNEIRKSHNEIKDLIKEIGKFKVSLEFKENGFHNKNENAI